MAVIVRWRRLAADDAAVAHQAREVAQCVARHLQRPISAPAVETARPNDSRGDEWKTQQAVAPLGYVEPYERLVSIEWLGDNGGIRFARADGSIVEAKSLRAARTRPLLDAVDEIGPSRRPMQIHYRPGQGGHRRRVLDGEIDVREGLEAYGEVTWVSAPGGAYVGVIDCDPDGNAVADARLSSTDKNEALVDQIDAAFVLMRRNPEIRVRKILLAENMSGKRQVRPDRAGPPAPGELERDDMLVLDQWLIEGWVEHLLWRDPTRIARDLLPGYTLLDRWERSGTNLWLAEWGRNVDFEADRSNLGMQMIVSAEERARLTRRLQSARIRKGPLVGKGWVGRNRFGFMRDRVGNMMQDPEQWPWIRRGFELADGDPAQGLPGLSTREVAAALAAEGCTFDHDRVRTLLKDKIYATGEFTVTVRGVEIAQKPVPLVDPVPLDQFLRVQEMLALRGGGSEATPLGEFLLNYVHAVHKRCKNQKAGRNGDKRVRIRGYIDRRHPTSLRYRHTPAVPPCCVGGGPGGPPNGWTRDELERPILIELRRLASHPAILRELDDIARHNTSSNGSAALTDQQVDELKRQAEDLRNKRDAAIEAWVDSIPMGETPDMAAARRLMQAFDMRIAAIEARLQRDQDVRRAHSPGGQVRDAKKRDERLAAFLEILTVETPHDLRHKALRARLFERLVHAVEIDDDDGTIIATIEGFLVPPDEPYTSRDLVDTSADLLDAYLLEKKGKPLPADPMLRRVGKLRAESQTDLSESTDKSVWELYPDLLTLPSNDQIAALERRDFVSNRWRYAGRCKDRKGLPAWSFRVTVAVRARTARRLPEVGSKAELRGRRIRQAALWVMVSRHLGERVHYSDLLDEVLRAGFVIPMKNPSASLFWALTNSRAFDHPARGLFVVAADVVARLEAEIRECHARVEAYQRELAALPADAHRREAPSAEAKKLQADLQEARWRERRLRENLEEVRMVWGVDEVELRQRIFSD